MADLMNYKGYRATAKYSEEDGCFVGQIIGIDDVIGFEGSTVEELRAMFREAVDSYLDWCRERGKKPDKEYKGSFNVRISPEKHGAAVKKATELGISLNQFVSEAIDEKLSGRREIRYAAGTENVFVSERPCAYIAQKDEELKILSEEIAIIEKYKNDGNQ